MYPLRPQRPDSVDYAGIRVMPCQDCSDDIKPSAKTTAENMKGAVRDARGRDIRPLHYRGRRTDVPPNRCFLLEKLTAHPPASSRSVVHCLPQNLLDGSPIRTSNSPVDSSISPSSCWPPVAFSVCPSVLHGTQNTRSRSPAERHLLHHRVAPAYSPPRLDSSKKNQKLTPPMRPSVVPSESIWTNGSTRVRSPIEKAISPVHWQPTMQEPLMSDDISDALPAPEPMAAPQLTSVGYQSVYFTRRPVAVERRIQVAMEKKSPELPGSVLSPPVRQDSNDIWEVQFRQRPPSVELRIQNAVDGPGDNIGALGMPPPDLRRTSDIPTKLIGRRPEAVERRIAKVNAGDNPIGGVCGRHALPVEAREDQIPEVPAREDKDQATMLTHLRRPPDVDKRIDRAKCGNIEENDGAFGLEQYLEATGYPSVVVAAPPQQQYVKPGVYPIERYSEPFLSGVTLDAGRNVLDIAFEYQRLTSASVLEQVFARDRTIPSQRPVDRLPKEMSALQSRLPWTTRGMEGAVPTLQYNVMPPVKTTDATSASHRQPESAYTVPGGWPVTNQDRDGTKHQMRPISEAVDALSQLPRMHEESSSSRRYGQKNAALSKQTDVVRLDSPKMSGDLALHERSLQVPPNPPTAPIATIPQPSPPCGQQASFCSFPLPCCDATPSLSSHDTHLKAEAFSLDSTLDKAVPWGSDHISTTGSALQPLLPRDIRDAQSSSKVSGNLNYQLSMLPQLPQQGPLTSSSSPEPLNGVLERRTDVPPRASEPPRFGSYSPSPPLRVRSQPDARYGASDAHFHRDTPVMSSVRAPELTRRYGPHSQLPRSLSGNDCILATVCEGSADIPCVVEEPPLHISTISAVAPKSGARSPPPVKKPRHDASATETTTSNTRAHVRSKYSFDPTQYHRSYSSKLPVSTVNRAHSDSATQSLHDARSVLVAGPDGRTDRRTVPDNTERSPLLAVPKLRDDSYATPPVSRSHSAPPTPLRCCSPSLTCPRGHASTREEGRPLAPARLGPSATNASPPSTFIHPSNTSPLETATEHASSPIFILEHRVLTPSSSSGDVGGPQPSPQPSIMARPLLSFENLPARPSTPVRAEVEPTQWPKKLDSLPFVPSSPIIPPSLHKGTPLMSCPLKARIKDEMSPKRGELMNKKKTEPASPRHVEEPTERSLSPPPRGDEIIKIKTSPVNARHVEKPTERSLSPQHRGDEINQIKTALANSRRVEESTKRSLSPPHRGDKIYEIKTSPVNTRHVEEPTERSLSPPPRGDEIKKIKTAPANARHVEEPTERSLSPPHWGDEINQIKTARANSRRVEKSTKRSLSPPHRGDKIYKKKTKPVNARHVEEPTERSLSPPPMGDEIKKIKTVPANARHAEEPTERSLSPPHRGDEMNQIKTARANSRHVEESTKCSLSPPARGDKIYKKKTKPVNARHIKEPIERSLSPPHRGDEMNKIKTAQANVRHVEEPTQYYSLSPPPRGDEINQIKAARASLRRTEESTGYPLSPPRLGGKFNEMQTAHANAPHVAQLTEQNVPPHPGQMERMNTPPNRIREEEAHIERHALTPPKNGEMKTMAPALATTLRMEDYAAFRMSISSDDSDCKKVRTHTIGSLSTRGSMEKADLNAWLEKVDETPVKTSWNLNSAIPICDAVEGCATQADFSGRITTMWTEEDAQLLSAMPLCQKELKEGRKTASNARADRSVVGNDEVTRMSPHGVLVPTRTYSLDLPHDNSLSPSRHVISDVSPLQETECVFRKASDRLAFAGERVAQVTEEGISMYPVPLGITPPRLSSARSFSNSIPSAHPQNVPTHDSRAILVEYPQDDARRVVNPPRLGMVGAPPGSTLPERSVRSSGEDVSSGLSNTFGASLSKPDLSSTDTAKWCADSVLDTTETSVPPTSGLGDIASAGPIGEYDVNTHGTTPEYIQPRSASFVDKNHPTSLRNHVPTNELGTCDANIHQDVPHQQAGFLETANQAEHIMLASTLSPVTPNLYRPLAVRSTDVADTDGALPSDHHIIESIEDISWSAPPQKQGEPKDTTGKIVSPERTSPLAVTTDVGTGKAMEWRSVEVEDSCAQLAERSSPRAVTSGETIFFPLLPRDSELSEVGSVASEDSQSHRNVQSTVFAQFSKRSGSPPVLRTYAPHRAVSWVLDSRPMQSAKHSTATAKRPRSCGGQPFISNWRPSMTKPSQTPFFHTTRFLSRPNTRPIPQTHVVTTAGRVSDSASMFPSVSAVVGETRSHTINSPPVSAVAVVKARGSTNDKSLIDLATKANIKHSRIIIPPPPRSSITSDIYDRDSVVSETHRIKIGKTSWVHPVTRGGNVCRSITNPLPLAPEAPAAETADNISFQPVTQLYRQSLSAPVAGDILRGGPSQNLLQGHKQQSILLYGFPLAVNPESAARFPSTSVE